MSVIKSQYIRLLLAVLLIMNIVCFLGCRTTQQRCRAINDEPEMVSLIALIANPESYHGKKIRVIGYGRFEYEVSGIFLFEGGVSHDPINALWLEFPNEHYNKAVHRCHKKSIIVEGVFDKKICGHFGMYSGGIKNIDRLDIVSQDPSLPITRIIGSWE